VLALGVAGKRPAICVESTAFNEAEYFIPDHNGNLYENIIDADAAPTLVTPLDTLEIKCAILRSGVPAFMSEDAGRYVCNHFYFRLLQHLPARCLFLHLPRLPEVEAAHGGDGPTMTLETSERAVQAAIDYLQSNL
jgi:pyroglutamyl-peptidase